MLGVCYYPEHWPEDWWAEDARRMKALGIDVVRIGEFAWSRLEPSRGDLRLDWMMRAMDVLHAAGLKIILGTPTATPPRWLVEECPDILPHDAEGRVRGFGSRRHYTFASERFVAESRRIVEIVARHFGEHPGLVGWQTDNEYGCHETGLSHGPEDLKGFQQWLRRRYQDAGRLNEAWGNVFWSMEVGDFSEVVLPFGAVTETNPAARLDFWRYQSDLIVAYDKMQCEIIRAHSPGRWITHNFMGFVNDFDHFAVGDNLEVASWDSYPIGFVEKFPFTEEERNRWAETSHPDIAPFHHDLYRAVGKGRFAVMEQQPGPVNWAAWNPVPKPGMVRLWTLEAIAHGAEFVSYFRWRQAHFAQEQMHAGLNLPGRHQLSPGGREAEQAARDLEALGPLPTVGRAPVAILYDDQTDWATMIQPQGQDFRYEELAFRWYEALRRLGLDVDFVRPGAPLEGYALVLVPSLMIVDDQSLAALEASSAVVLIGPRSGSRNRHFAIPEELPPGPLAGLTGATVLQVSSLRPGLSESVLGAVTGRALRWREYVEAEDGAVLARFAAGDPALTARGKRHYLACWPDEDLLHATLRLLVQKAGLSILSVPEAVRLRRRGDLTFVFNYGCETWTAPEGDYRLGSRAVPPQGVAVFR